jgi:hypothetical protein
MNQHETAEPVRTEKPDLRSFLVAEAPAIAGMVSALIAYAFEDVLFADSTITRSPSCCSSGCSGP